MPGFAGFIGKNNVGAEAGYIQLPTNSKTDEKQYIFKNFFIRQNIIPKFINDKMFANDDDIFICTDGIILNSKELHQEYAVTTNFGLIKTLYKNDGTMFAHKMHGNFSGCLYNKKDDSLLIFTDHFGAKPLFYFFDEQAQYFIFGSELKFVAFLMKFLGFKVPISEIGAYCLLTFGYMLEDYTLVDTIKRLTPGSTLTYKNRLISVKQYYRLDNSNFHKENERSIIANLSDLFTKAIIAEYNKDQEYSYAHIGSLSGGRDSRMNILSAKKIGYTDIYTMTYSQSNYYDEKISKSIATRFGLNSIFYSLDNGNHLNDIEGPAFANDGLILYSGSSHTFRMVSLLNWPRFGLLHTAILGGTMLGAQLVGNEHIKPNPSHGSYSQMLFSRIKTVATNISEKYENAELYMFYNRGVNGSFNIYRMAQQFTEFSSPFLYQEFADYVLKVDPKLRYKYKIYDKWMFEYLPEATTFIWEKTRTKIGAGEVSIYARKILKHGRKLLWGASPNDSMYPIDYWFKSNNQLTEKLDQYFSVNIERLRSRKELQRDVVRLFTEGRPLEKTQALTLLAATKLLDLDID